MDYKECLKVHGYIADKSDSENSNVEEIYNRYKPPPVPYSEFKHRVVTIYADSGTTSESNNTSSNSSNTFPSANPSATVQRNRSTPAHSTAVARPVSNVNSVLQQQQLDQFTKSYQQQQRTATPIRDILCQPNTERARVRGRGRTRVKSPVHAPVVPPQAASRVYTLTPPTNIPVHNTWTERRAAVHSEPAQPPSPRNDIQVPYQPLVTHRQQQQQQAEEDEEEEETKNCCCCIC